ncbi:MAG TPA: ANTAR domain-containing protein [Acidimicrobiales bacterium]|nr:ANTAR domain-containing protein [Acidimicrobiales bacterium]
MGIDVDQAFGKLRNHARNHNLRLLDVAQDVLDGGLSGDAFNPASPSQRW